MRTTRIIPIIASVLIASTVAAAPVPMPDVAASPKAMALLKRLDPHIHIVKRFDGPSGMTGYVINGGGNTTKVLVWMTPGDDYLLVGNLIDSYGRNLTNLSADYYKAENPINTVVNAAITDVSQRVKSMGEGNSTSGQPSTDKPTFNAQPGALITGTNAALALDAATKRVADKATITQGTGSKGTIYVFTDPKCPHCRDLHEWLLSQPYIGDYKIEWIMVAIFGTKDLALSSQILSKGSPNAVTAGFMDNLLDNNVPGREYIQRVMDNTEALSTVFGRATPAIVIEKKGGQPVAILGPNSSQLTELLGGKNHASK